MCTPDNIYQTKGEKLLSYSKIVKTYIDNILVLRKGKFS